MIPPPQIDPTDSADEAWWSVHFAPLVLLGALLALVVVAIVVLA